LSINIKKVEYDAAAPAAASFKINLTSTGGAKVRISIFVVAAAIAITSTSAMAGDPNPANIAKTVCAGCHGPEGISTNPLWPNLAGQKELYLSKAINDYRSGARKDPVMGPLAQGLSDRDVEELAAYYSNK
jgi:cytochrome c553